MTYVAYITYGSPHASAVLLLGYNDCAYSAGGR